MSDAREDAESLGRLAIRGSQIEPLQHRLRAFVDEHDDSEDVETLRERSTAGRSLADLVAEERDERLE